MSRRRIAQRLHRARLRPSSAKHQSRPPSKSLICAEVQFARFAIAKATGRADSGDGEQKGNP